MLNTYMSKEGRGELVGNSKIFRQASHVAKRLGVLRTSRASSETMQAILYDMLGKKGVEE